MNYNPRKPLKGLTPCQRSECMSLFIEKANKKFCSLKCKNAVSNPKREFNSIDVSGLAEAHKILHPDTYNIEEVTKENDNINPDYYKGDIECIDAIKASMSLEAFKGYLKGNILKYTWRDKNDKKEDLDKAIWYTNKLKEQL